MKRVVLAAVVAVALLSGCAQSASTGVSKSAAATLEPFVQAVRTAASGTSAGAVRGAVRALDAEVERLVRSGGITAGRAKDIEDQAGVVGTDFGKVKPSPSPSPSVTPTSPSPSVTPTTPTPTPTVTVTVTPTITPSTPSTGTPGGPGGPPSSGHTKAS